MIQFDYLWVWLLLPLPWLAWRWLPAFRPEEDRLRVPYTSAFYEQLEDRQSTAIQIASRSTLIIQWLIWLLLLGAAARPVLLEPPIHHTEPRRDLILAIDLSQSMSEQDVPAPDGQRLERLSAVKQAAARFIAQRSDDRIGLVGFGDQAFPLAPPSSEHESLLQILALTETGIAGANTAMGDAIGVTLKLLESSQMPEQVMILLSDGEDNRSRLDPLQAARIAAERNLQIHTIAFGQTEGSGDNRVDRDTLEAIAQRTGGQAFLASDQQALEQVYARIDTLTPHIAEELRAQPRRELFWIPTALALGVLILQLLPGLVSAALQRPQATAGDR